MPHSLLGVMPSELVFLVSQVGVLSFIKHCVSNPLYNPRSEVVVLPW